MVDHPRRRPATTAARAPHRHARRARGGHPRARAAARAASRPNGPAAMGPPNTVWVCGTRPGLAGPDSWAMRLLTEYSQSGDQLVVYGASRHPDHAALARDATALLAAAQATGRRGVAVLPARAATILTRPAPTVTERATPGPSAAGPCAAAPDTEGSEGHSRARATGGAPRGHRNDHPDGHADGHPDEHPEGHADGRGHEVGRGRGPVVATDAPCLAWPAAARPGPLTITAGSDGRDHPDTAAADTSGRAEVWTDTDPDTGSGIDCGVRGVPVARLVVVLAGPVRAGAPTAAPIPASVLARCASTVAPGGLLAVLTPPPGDPVDPRPASRGGGRRGCLPGHGLARIFGRVVGHRVDPEQLVGGGMVAGLRAAGLSYQQHIVLVHADPTPDGLAAAPSPYRAGTPFRPVHTDLLILRHDPPPPGHDGAPTESALADPAPTDPDSTVAVSGDIQEA